MAETNRYSVVKKALAENGIAGRSSDLHSWRCTYYNEDCYCVDELIVDILNALDEQALEDHDGG